jgi:agmatine deiminase
MSNCRNSRRCDRALARASFLLAVAGLCAGLAAQPVYPEGAPVPRSLTDAERAWLQSNPLVVPQAVTPPPTGPVVCPGEYEPMEGIILAWEGPTDWLNVVAEMAALITTVGNATAFVTVDAPGESQAATTAISSRGGNTARVRFISRTIDSIWIRDYGPRYIYEGAPGRQVRAIVDHTYNRPRPNDDTFNQGWTTFRKHQYYELPLVHGGGNYHLNSLRDAFATRLIVNENPTLTPTQVIDIWRQYQNVETMLLDPFPANIDSTQHLDMWMQITGDSSVMISNWDANAGSTQAVISDNAATMMASRGYTVTRVPARSIGGTHYTYTNVVMCNDLVIIPGYSDPGVQALNATALAAWQAALPGKTIRQINGQPLVVFAGVFHCIAMHVPAHRGVPTAGGLAPTVRLRSLRGGQVVQPGQQVQITWASDDDESVANIDIFLSRDGGVTYPTRLANRIIDTGTFNWTVPSIFAPQARIRVIARDAAGRTGDDSSDTNFTINGTPCQADFNRDGTVDFFDYLDFIAAFSAEAAGADFNGDGSVDFFDYLDFVARFNAGC